MNTEQQQIANDKQQRLDYQILEDLLEQISIGADSQESNFHKYGKQAERRGYGISNIGFTRSPILYP